MSWHRKISSYPYAGWQADQVTADELRRSEEGTRLSNLAEATTDPMVRADALCKLGVLYMTGGGGLTNNGGEAQAHFILAREAVPDHADALYYEGLMYVQGLGVQGENELISQKYAEQLFELAAKKGHPGAQYMLGGMREHGAGGLFGVKIRKDRREAARLYRLAADQGHREAQVRLENL